MALYPYAILIDFGSTYTKVAAVDIGGKRLLHTDHFPSTVATDARVGLGQCFDSARRAIGEKAFGQAVKLSSSSAAGGLRMGVVGLTRNLSIAAGRNAAFGAGAKILHTGAGKLTERDIASLESQPIEILLFCGGYEDGSVHVLLHNAALLARSKLAVPVIFAGNSRAAEEVSALFYEAGKDCHVADNIIPEIGEVNPHQVEKIIRDVFLKRIINMKGLDSVAAMLDRMVMPTPAAVLAAGELLSRGSKSHSGMGPLMIVDVGGATTDIHSYANAASYEGAKIIGAKEPYAKRTVEGDLGMRESANSLAREIGEARFAKDIGVTEEQLLAVIQKWQGDHEALPSSPLEETVDRHLASYAVRFSARRHAGWIEHIVSTGLNVVQHGKDLTGVRNVIGTGGPVVFSKTPGVLLSQALRRLPVEEDVLLPERAQFWVDESYVFFAAGLLREVDEDAAFLLMRNSIKKAASDEAENEAL
jgi:uncharacterized protein (TIGR01319 family)